MYLTVILILISVVYMANRYRSSMVGDNVVGFFYNPLFWLVSFSIFYMLVGNLFVANAFVYDFFGLEDYYGSTKESVVKVNLFYFILFLFYFFSKDVRLVKSEFPSISETYKVIILFLGLSLLGYFLFVSYLSLLYLYPLRGVSRVLAFNAYVEYIFLPYKYGVFVNLSILYLFLSMMFKNYKLNYLVATFVVGLLFFIDYMHGGRSVTFRVAILIYLLFVINKRRSYLLYISFTFLLLALAGWLQRGLVFESFESLYVFFGEFILTRSTTDVVLSAGLNGEPIQPALCFIFSVFPGVVSNFFSIDPCFISEALWTETGLSFGLGSNLVSESIYYFGDYYFMSAFVIGLYFYLFNRYAYRLGFLGLLMLVFVLVSIQDIVRTSFYDFGLIVFYLMFSYYLVFSFLFYKKRLLSFM